MAKSRWIPDQLRCNYLANPLAVDTPRPHLSWILKAGEKNTERGIKERAWQALVAGEDKPLTEKEADLWNSGKVESEGTVRIEYEGKPLRSGERCRWKVRVWTSDGAVTDWSEPACWGMGLLEPGDWKSKWIGAGCEIPHPAPCFRREFRVEREIKGAFLHATALGAYEARLNGKRVGDHILAPEWTSYHKRLQYQTYDVSPLLRKGDNVIAARVGDGWYAGRIGMAQIASETGNRGIYGRELFFRAQLHLEFGNGEKDLMPTDESWKCTLEGPILTADILDGEWIDARREMPGWDEVGFDDSSWVKVRIGAEKDVSLVAQPNEPIRIRKVFKAAAVTEPQKNLYIADFGQNMMGWCRLKLKGKRGRIITLRHGERLDASGRLYTRNLRGARQTDQYICRGSGEETFEPHFTYHGFQFVEISGLYEKPAPEDITACAFWSDFTETGAFSCSSGLLNQLFSNILWTQRSNMPGIPTDCPQRDERLGWTGDIGIYAQTACFNGDMAAFFTKWLADLRDDQAEDGRFPDFAPHPFHPEKRFSGAPGWADAGVAIPWQVYLNYGDRALLRASYEPAKRWVNWIRNNNPECRWEHERGKDYGDWLNADTFKLSRLSGKNAEIPKAVFATAIYCRSVHILSKMARVVGEKAEVIEFEELAEAIKKAFLRAFLKEDGKIEGDTQAGYAIALGYDLLPEKLQPSALHHLIEGLAPFRGHLSTGFIGTPLAMAELTRRGHAGIAYERILDRTFPSWGYTIEQGATTIWERWDGYVEGKGFQNPGMNSFSHYAIGAVGEWIYRTILGINPDEEHPGYGHFILRPIPGGGLQWARGAYDSIRGRIEVDWTMEREEAFHLALSLPPNTTATLYFPYPEAEEITAKEKPAKEGYGFRLLRKSKGETVFSLASGNFLFRSVFNTPASTHD